MAGTEDATLTTVITEAVKINAEIKALQARRQAGRNIAHSLVAMGIGSKEQHDAVNEHLPRKVHGPRKPKGEQE